MYKRWGRGPVAHEVLGFLFAAYLRFVRRANRFVQEPADLDAFLARQTPFIVAMWHGQHLMIPYARTKSIARIAALTSRSRDGGPQAVALRHLGIMPVRGSGGKPGQARQKGGAAGLLRLKRELDDGATVALTADVSKRPRVAGLGIVTLAKLSGRPIAPTAVVTSRRFDFDSWDRASIGKPFGRGAIVVGDFIDVPADADDAALEVARRAVQSGLDEVHRRAYALVGARDPGAGLRPA
jgi:lysophospholipid acyltransferase (LPLAT)-like uncharacterized protein